MIQISTSQGDMQIGLQKLGEIVSTLTETWTSQQARLSQKFLLKVMDYFCHKSVINGRTIKMLVTRHRISLSTFKFTCY